LYVLAAFNKRDIKVRGSVAELSFCSAECPPRSRYLAEPDLRTVRRDESAGKSPQPSRGRDWTRARGRIVMVVIGFGFKSAAVRSSVAPDAYQGARRRARL